MSGNFCDGNEDEILAKVQAESLRHYEQFELPRIENRNPIQEIDVANGEHLIGGAESYEMETSPPKSAGIKSMDGISLCTQVGGKAGALLYDGEEAKGFHIDAGSSYIYPTNYPIRQYQAAIVRNALFQNTLVGLPTGLGKTFIAAVVMYNFYRWYPRSKIVFMAPTRPLVAQQIKACYNVMGIPPNDTTEMTGAQSVDVREKLWKEKRVFFLTPQVLTNDLISKTCPANMIKCVVFDEAHRATKEYAYCQVVRLLEAANALYRTLALSATPGNDINAVIQVIRNLNISCLEMRGEDSLDVKPYTHGKSVEQIVVDLSPEILRVKDDFMQVYEGFVRKLMEHRVLTSNIAYLSKFQILKQMEKFRANPPRGMSTTVIGSLVSDFTMCMTMAHALELLQIYGLRAFYRYLSDEGDKPKATTTRLRHSEGLQKMLSQLRSVLYPNPNSDIPYTWGHPKLKKLVSLLTDHFKKAEAAGEKSKVIVFCQYKVVVNEIVDMLVRCDPSIKAAIFVGQSGGKERGMPQSKQLQIMKDFREGKINCLVATCVAEEGLDIGEVDLIVLMESQKSPVRLVQRLGRTGRKRKGRCIVFSTRGKEEKKFHEAMASRKSYVRNIVDSKSVKNSLCQYSPPMLPPGIKPKQQLVHIKIAVVETPQKPVKGRNKQMDIRSCVVPEVRPFLDEETTRKLTKDLEVKALNFDRLPSRKELWWRAMDSKISVDELLNTSSNALASWNDWNLDVHQTYVISSTSSSKLYCDLISSKTREKDVEFLKLVEDYKGQPIGVEVGAKRNDGIGNEKKPKKNAKKNYGMDIRACMAAVNQPCKMPKFDIFDDDDDVIFVEQSGPESPKRTPQPAGMSDLMLKDMASIFGLESDEFENILFSCPPESAKTDMGKRLNKYLNLSSHSVCKPKITEREIVSFNFQCDQMLKLLENGGIPSELLNCTLCSRNQSPEDKPDRQIEEQVDDNLVDIDELFASDDGFDNNLEPSIGEAMPVEHCDAKLDQIQDPTASDFAAAGAMTPKMKPCVDEVEISPIPVLNNVNSVWSTGSAFKLSPIGKPPMRPVSSTPLNPSSKRNLFSMSNLKQNKKSNDAWDLDEILEEEANQNIGDVEVAGSFSGLDIFASSSSGKVSKPVLSNVKDVFKTPVAPGNKRPSSDDYLVELDDLFEDEALSTKQEPSDTSFYTITQLVSQIEREKNKCNNSDNSSHPREARESLHCVSSQNRSDIRENTKHMNPNHAPSFKAESTLESTRKVSPLTSLDCSLIPKSNCVAKSEMNYSNKLISEDVIIIDSQEDVSPKKNVPSAKLSPKNDSKDLSSERFLLDEDEDIFKNVNIDELNQGSKKPTKQPKPVKNVKTFKHKSALSRLDFEPDNDSPEHTKEVQQNVANSPSTIEGFLTGIFSQVVNKNVQPSLKISAGRRQRKNFSILDSDSDQSPLVKPIIKKSPLPLSSGVSSKRKLSFENGEIGEKSQPTKKTRRVDLSLLSGSDSEIFMRAEGKSKTNQAMKEATHGTRPKIVKKRKKSKGVGAALIDREAEESGILSTDDSDDSMMDEMDSSFVDDGSNEEESYAYYLKSVKSPVLGGKFKIPINKKYKPDVYSQVVELDDYENDSFCVGDDEEISEHESSSQETLKKRSAKRRHYETEDKLLTSSESIITENRGMRKKRRLLESDSDVTPDRAPPKKSRNPLISPEADTTLLSPHSQKPSQSLRSSPELPKTTHRIDSAEEHDSDEDLKKALLLSQMEAATFKDADAQFEEDLKKALILSQRMDVRMDVKSNDADVGTSYMFLSQTTSKEKMPLTTNQNRPKVSKLNSKKTFLLDFSSDDSD